MRIIDKIYIRVFPVLFTCIVLATAVTRLALMQTEHMPQLGAAFLTYLFALTSILYARARTAIVPADIEHRGEIADECLKTAILASLVTVVTGFVFFALGETHAIKLGHVLDGKTVPDTAPMVWAFICTSIFLPVIAKLERVISMTAVSMGIGKTTKKAEVNEKPADR